MTARHFPLVGRITTLAAAMAVVGICCMATVAVACPNCADAVASQTGDGSGQMKGYFWSIVSMVSMPFLLTGAAIGYFALASRRRTRAIDRP